MLTMCGMDYNDNIAWWLYMLLIGKFKIIMFCKGIKYQILVSIVTLYQYCDNNSIACKWTLHASYHKCAHGIISNTKCHLVKIYNIFVSYSMTSNELNSSFNLRCNNNYFAWDSHIDHCIQFNFKLEHNNSFNSYKNIVAAQVHRKIIIMYFKGNSTQFKSWKFG